MGRSFYRITRALHLYLGLFFSPFVLVFAVSVPFLVHNSIPGQQSPAPLRPVSGLALPGNLETLSGRARIDALRSCLPALGVNGEIGFVRYLPAAHRLFFPVTVPGRETTVELDLTSGSATLSTRELGLWDALVSLHKSPGPHLVDIRMNWHPMLLWRWFSDASVALLLFISLSGIYLWALLRAERKAGLALLIAGALAFVGSLYAVIH